MIIITTIATKTIIITSEGKELIIITTIIFHYKGLSVYLYVCIYLSIHPPYVSYICGDGAPHYLPEIRVRNEGVANLREV